MLAQIESRRSRDGNRQRQSQHQDFDEPNGQRASCVDFHKHSLKSVELKTDMKISYIPPPWIYTSTGTRYIYDYINRSKGISK
jgi:hypothetical protein